MSRNGLRKHNKNYFWLCINDFWIYCFCDAVCVLTIHILPSTLFFYLTGFFNLIIIASLSAKVIHRIWLLFTPLPFCGLVGVQDILDTANYGILQLLGIISTSNKGICYNMHHSSALVPLNTKALQMGTRAGYWF